MKLQLTVAVLVALSFSSSLSLLNIETGYDGETPSVFQPKPADLGIRSMK